VACTDKTGMLTEGRLAVSDVTTADGEPELPGGFSRRALDVLLSAALASPHPDAADAQAHPTDVAVIDAAQDAGLGAIAARPRQAEWRFDPVTGFHASVCGDACTLRAPAR